MFIFVCFEFHFLISEESRWSMKENVHEELFIEKGKEMKEIEEFDFKIQERSKMLDIYKTRENGID